MLCRADSLGVFQVESRAQMNFLPRMRPRCFYDLVIEVAIVRPGPIQGDMVHPYLRRRNGEEAVSFPSDELGQVLGKTLGVPLFQEQAMQIAIVGAGFTPEEADRCAALATFKKHGTIHEFRDRSSRACVANGYDADFAERCFKQIEGFGRIRLSRKPRGELRAAGLRLGLAEAPPSGHLRLRAAEQRSRWASTRRRRSCATPASTGWRCGPSASTPATGTT
jgi:hypothetical protein